MGEPMILESERSRYVSGEEHETVTRKREEKMKVLDLLGYIRIL